MVSSRRKRTRKGKGKDWTNIGALIFGFVVVVSAYPEVLAYTFAAFLILLTGYLFYRFGPYKLNIFRSKYRNSSIKEVDGMDGLQFEHFLKPVFQAKGYRAEVTQGSGDYGADLILTRKGKKTVVQAKCYSSNIGVDAIQQVVAAMPVYRAQHAIVVTNRYYTKQAKKLAKANRVLLIDRDELINMINHYQNGTSSVFNRLLAPFRLRLDRD